MKRLFTLLILVFTVLASFAASGVIRGQVIDDATGEELIGVYVINEANGKGTTTDLDGNFALDVEEGTHNLKFSYISYASKVVTDVQVKPNDVSLLNVRLSEAAAEIAEVQVTAKAIRNTESALLTIQRKSANVIDGISSQTFSKNGDGSAAAAVSRVTGVSVEGGKHVYVRGLGDRYTKTILNGMEIPGLDPDRNTVQMDIFPTNLINNIVIYKTFTPDLPGDFTGGVVNIETKDFPDKKTLSANVGFGYNPRMHFNNEYVTYNGGSTDWLGFDDGTRGLDFDARAEIPDPVEVRRNVNGNGDVLREADFTLTEFSNSFDQQMSVFESTSGLNSSFGFAAGNQKNKEKVTLGYNFVANYKRDYNFYDDVVYGGWQLNPDAQVNELLANRVSTGKEGELSTLLSGLLVGSMKVKNHKISLSGFRTQNGISKASEQFTADEFNGKFITQNNLEYTQRSISNVLLSAEHNVKDIEISHKHSYTASRIYDPDARVSAFELRDQLVNGERVFEKRLTLDGGKLNRFYRDLRENNFSSRVDVIKPFKQWSGLAAKFKGGAFGTVKSREFEIFRFSFRARKETDLLVTGTATELLADDNLYDPVRDTGFYVLGNFNEVNVFDASSTKFGGYAMTELPLTSRLKLITGARVEKLDYYYSGTGLTNQGDRVVLENENTLNELFILPSFNLVFGINEKMNFRGSYSRTVALPSFREKSYAQIEDPISGRRFFGNINLEHTNINNFDLRYEWFFNRGEVLSVSTFVKTFTNPIEISALKTNTNEFQPINAGSAAVVGIELEGRKNLGFIKDELKNLSLSANVTFVGSAVDMKTVTVDNQTGESEFDLRQANAREGQTIEQYRRMSGQSPYILNIGASYSEPELGFDATLSYNVQGRRLSVIGLGSSPDVYEDPFHSLNFKTSYKFGNNDAFKVSASVNNILGDNQLRVYQGFNSTDQIFEQRSIGREFNVGFSYTIR